VIEEIDTILAPYGGQGAHGRDGPDVPRLPRCRTQQLEAMSRMLPPIFLVVAAFLVNMTLARLITLEREQIGLLKALGYDVAWLSPRSRHVAPCPAALPQGL
jgi:putative ABC transport system permease protein